MNAISHLRVALHRDGINPNNMVVLLPRGDWETLLCHIKANTSPGYLPVPPPLGGDEFQLMGISFRVKPEEEQKPQGRGTFRTQYGGRW